MKLVDYLAEKKFTDAAFGALIGRDRTSVMRLRRGETRPDWETMQRISEATDGAVTPNDFLDPITPSTRSPFQQPREVDA